ncbi:MAG TPA: prepilin-type N-terminal cleavage/methylation domain-containing protein [Longimicrobiales bacterium]|nr:prepilin-type N-terminal cleavage/methylation domain-containing protein [Longimicrobiales bacterium]
MQRRGGFTLIELLIVIVIIGILAAVALPKFGGVRERAHFRSLMSDLRNLNTQQELYFTTPKNNYTYAATMGNLSDYQTSLGVTVAMFGVSNQGWAATAGHIALTTSQLCGIYIGTTASVPGFLTSPGVVACTGE